jgi:outer membrane protein TolC
MWKSGGGDWELEAMSPNLQTCISRVVTRSLFATAVLVCLVAVRGGAQEPVTVERAVQATLAHNAALRAARASVDEAAARTEESRAGFFPRISLSESWQRGDQPVFVFSSLLSSRQFAANNFAIDALNHPDPIGFFRLGFGVEQLLFDGGRQRSLTDAATLRQTIADASASEAAAGLAVATVEVFGRVVNGEADHRAAEAGVAAAREDLARAERRRDAGLATDADVLALAVHVAELQQRAIQADSDTAAARAELNRLMGIPIDEPVQVVAPVAASQGAEADVKSLFAEAEAARPELKRIAASEGVAAAARRQARSSVIPQIAAQAAVDVAGTEVADRASSWIVGAELKWTFSTGGAELAGMKAAAASLARARAEAEDVRARIHVEIVTALRRVEAARARYAVGRATVEQARESQRIIRDRFDVGVAPVNDVLRASTALLDAEANSTAAVVDVMVATATLRRAVGRVP